MDTDDEFFYNEFFNSSSSDSDDELMMVMMTTTMIMMQSDPEELEKEEEHVLDIKGSTPDRITHNRKRGKGPQGSVQKFAKSWRTIKQLTSLDPKEYNEDTMFLCKVSLTDIDCTSGWCYLGCDTCHKSLSGAPRKYKCSQCGPIKRPIQWYKLKAKVQDSTGTMNLMIFCEVAEELVGVSAEELVHKIKDAAEWYTLPGAVSRLLGSTHTFQVFHKYGYGNLSVKAIMDHVNIPVTAATTNGKGKKKCVPGSADSGTTSEPSVNSSPLLKPNKRLRGDDSTN